MLKKILSFITLFTVVFFNLYSQNYNKVSVADIEKAQKDNKFIIVDTRINDAFNGWAMDNMKNGGHIEGATDFSFNWVSTDAKDKDKILDKILLKKGITKDKNIILYDSNNKDSLVIAEYLSKKGYTNISLFNVKDWENSGNKFKSYPNYNLIAPASILYTKIKNNEGYQVFEVAWGEEKMDKDYLEGHLPSAIHINTDEIEFPPLWSIVSDEKLMNFAKNNGITKDSKVILYSTDPMPSYRISAILQYMGVKEVIVLNGGLPAWKRENLPLETKSNPKKPTTSFGSDKPLNKEFIVGIDRAKYAIANPSKEILVDIRTLDEHQGKISGYSDLKYKGRPTGAVWGESGSDANHLEAYRNIDNTLKNGDEILARWKELGITPDKRLTFFCGSGWRAAEVLVYSKVIGVKDSALYSNGWYEWSSDKNNPVTIGK